MTDVDNPSDLNPVERAVFDAIEEHCGWTAAEDAYRAVVAAVTPVLHAQFCRDYVWVINSWDPCDKQYAVRYLRCQLRPPYACDEKAREGWTCVDRYNHKRTRHISANGESWNAMETT